MHVADLFDHGDAGVRQRLFLVFGGDFAAGDNVAGIADGGAESLRIAGDKADSPAF